MYKNIIIGALVLVIAVLGYLLYSVKDVDIVRSENELSSIKERNKSSKDSLLTDISTLIEDRLKDSIMIVDLQDNYNAIQSEVIVLVNELKKANEKILYSAHDNYEYFDSLFTRQLEIR